MVASSTSIALLPHLARGSITVSPEGSCAHRPLHRTCAAVSTGAGNDPPGDPHTPRHAAQDDTGVGMLLTETRQREVNFPVIRVLAPGPRPRARPGARTRRVALSLRTAPDDRREAATNYPPGSIYRPSQYIACELEWDLSMLGLR